MKSLKSAILKEIEIAINDARLSDRTMEETVHSVRRRCKRIRAYLRLLPDSLSKPTRRARRFVRLAATSLSALRDAQVMIRICQQIHRQLSKTSVEASQPGESSSSYLEKNAPSPCLPTAPECELEKAATLLEKAHGEIVLIKGNLHRESILKKLQQTYKLGRRATRRIIDRMDSDDFHELRKMTKQLFYQCQFVASRLQVSLDTDIDRSRLLGDKLGDALDLSVLASNLSNVAQEEADKESVAAMLVESEALMNAHFKEAVPLACQLFFDRPIQFSQRIKQC